MKTEEKKIDTTEAVVQIDKKELRDIVEEMSAKNKETTVKREKKVNVSAVDTKKLQEAVKREGEINFFKAIANEDVATIKGIHEARAKALNEGTNSAGGYLVPTEFEKRVHDKLDDYSQIRKEAQVLPMGSETLNLNSLVTDVSVTIEGETDAIAESDAAFGEPVLTARKYAAISAFSAEVYEDAEVDLLNYLAGRYAQALAKSEEDQFVNGTVSGSEGLLQVAGTSAVDMAVASVFTDITWDNLADMIKEANEYSVLEGDNGVFAMSPSVWNAVLQTKPTNATYYGNGPVTAASRMAWGKRVILSNSFPSTTAASTKFAVYGDLSKHLMIGDRAGLRVKILEEGTVGSNNLGEQDMQALRIVKRTANTVVLPSGLVTLATGAAS